MTAPLRLGARPLRLGAYAWPVERIATMDEYAAHLDRVVAEGARQADLLLMPEYACMEAAAALTGGSADPTAELAAIVARSDEILDIMIAAARKHGVWLMPGTLPRPEPGYVRNRAPLIAPDGRVALQDKHVMTRFETEAWGVQAGAPPGVFDTPWGMIGTAICYDSEFPMLTRAQVETGAWLILVPTCTDTMHGFNRVRVSAQARALENQCFVAVAPTVGDAPWLATLDENRGQAGIYGPIDRGFPSDGIIAEGPLNAGGWAVATLDPTVLEDVRQNGAVRNCRDWPRAVPRATTLPFSFSS
ncbi:carbon-nitrogen hydrolase family protein [Acidomonas methanolica]|uniref:Carbon-nitrogen hydrolase n=2 Tax=Acidomonas methanolica TaxID=437 RepID=A0A023D7E7_ACIMT|nr:carbon-nitrogen hydrolase family protein [Acidomonas methanolica]MBU2655439.1 carbon-nitrogen hydrolase family protein [Acidomonas methanolica]MCQ9156403.1 carbon-nitrogen hydrolase family protein [Acidomonas methanolica]TCS23322.1 putative amidohydrolase [Acidomonas methanolica]GAJ29691.1 carbon-nitrogen hydrolase [Acidomonas methanolica NBRC 104435]GEL00265.1 amidohydrolase [Acidomonas methanolica NBRC 104435]